MLSILCVELTIKVKVGIPGSFKVGWYPPPPKKKLGRVTLSNENVDVPDIMNSNQKLHFLLDGKLL